MSSDALPANVLDLITHRVDSMAQIEVLRHLHGAPERSWRPSELAESLPLDEPECARHLAQLETNHLVSADAASPGAYRYAAATAALAAAVDNLLIAYNTRPVTLVRALYARPAPAIRAFADAFRIRKPGE